MAAGAGTRLAFSNRSGAGNTPGGDRSHLRSTKGVCATSHSRRAEVRGDLSVWCCPPRPGHARWAVTGCPDAANSLNHSPGELAFLIVTGVQARF
jgi:hypothetical protein